MFSSGQESENWRRGSFFRGGENKKEEFEQMKKIYPDPRGGQGPQNELAAMLALMR
jgi:hypothetical protein